MRSQAYRWQNFDEANKLKTAAFTFRPPNTAPKGRPAKTATSALRAYGSSDDPFIINTVKSGETKRLRGR